MVAVRGSGIAYISAANEASIALPGGATAGDECLVLVHHPDGVVDVPPLGFVPIEESVGRGAAFRCNLTAAQISIGTVDVGFNGADYGTIAIIVFVGALAGIRTVAAHSSTSNSLTETVTTDGTPVSGDYVVYFGGGRFSTNVTLPTATSSAGGTLQSHSSTNAAGVLAGGQQRRRRGQQYLHVQPQPFERLRSHRCNGPKPD
jgi:hypothetical protein